MTELTTCKTCGVTQIPTTWFGECKRCYDMSEVEDTIDVMCNHEHLECPNGLDCNSFCPICEGNGEYCPMGCEMQYDEESGDIVYINLDACRLGCICKENNE